MDIRDKKTGIIGTGKLGKNLLYHLDKKGFKISGILNLNTTTSEEACTAVTTEIFKTSSNLAANSDIIFITTPDDSIEEEAKKISLESDNLKGKIFFHCSGSLPSTIMDSLKKKGAETASFHPLQSFADLCLNKNPFENIIAGIEGDHNAVKTGEQIAEILGCIPYILQTEGKVLYHAAAVIASNYLVTLTDISLEFLESAGIKKENGLNIIAPLMKGTLNNIIEKGPDKALTGPVSRGDSKTVRSHREKILTSVPEMDKFYKLMCEHTLTLATKSGSVSEKEIKDILDALKE
jgi:predicted short-subunit dehydrogenase-like oxidoreductase (DUF2520 family)